MNSIPASMFIRFFRELALGLALILTVALRGAAADPNPGPELQLSVLHPHDPHSWDPTDALAIQVELHHPGLSDESLSSDPLILAPATVAWPETISLRVKAPDGSLATWPFLRSGTSVVEPLELALGDALAMQFVLDTDAARRLPQGRYSLVATLDIHDGTGWTGIRESAPLSLVVGPPPRVDVGTLEVELVGGSQLAVGDPWVVAMRVLPPLGTGSETVLRAGYRFRVFDQAGLEKPWNFEPAATLPRFPGLADLSYTGLYPVLAVLPPSAATGLQAGTYRLEASWSGPPGGVGRTQSVNVVVSPLTAVSGNPGRTDAVLQQRLQWAKSLLWLAEYSSTTEIEQLSRQAAPLLLGVEGMARDAFRNEPPNPDTAFLLSEIYFLSGDFEAAEAFASLARGLHFPRLTLESLGLNSGLEEIDVLREAIATGVARDPGRVLPYLRPALQAARPPDLTAQWAKSARASTEYRATDYGASQATGAPNVTRHADNAKAWASKLADAGEEWLEVTYPTAVQANGVRIVQSFNPGAVVRIELLTESGISSTVWTGPDRTLYTKGEIGILEVSFPATTQPVARVKVVLDTKLVAGWNEIDAVQLLAAPAPLPAPRLVYQIDSNNPHVLEFKPWLSAHVLQRATRLSPPDWVDVVSLPPVRVEVGSQSAFFRLIKKP